MAKQLNVNMNFTADTSNVESNLNKLKLSLSQIASTPIKMTGLSTDLQKATLSAKELQNHLNNAFNVKTGNLDLNKLQNSLQQSGQSLTKLSSGLLGAGKTGEQAFLQMQTAISNANVQITKSTGFLSQMSTVLKNTVRWQLSSTMLHGFMSACQQAVGYVKDLNTSLTNIQIVTQQSDAKMAQFARTANEAAKSLSTTTTAYTDAALIYYQQGLNDEAVKERTDTTIKMANVTGQSAQEVSSYMTAIWNNFDDGSKSLEHYADVITNLGAHTASSSKEIAEGLEKFASVADTVGLSYDYATSALATVVAQTRQSADVVGTAFKTLFARLEGLQLGETLEDGTDLNKYSAALAKVGVNIKQANGDLKDMNTIVDEIGERWKTLTRDQQVALAETVGGMRQWTQFAALMNDYDTFKLNVEIAQDSEGVLQEQADIYADSWDGASKRVKASLQNIYSTVIDDKFIIKIKNELASIFDSIGDMLRNLGGFKTILMAISTIILSQLYPTIANGINNGITNTYNTLINIKNVLQDHNTKLKEATGFKQKIHELDQLNFDLRNASALALQKDIQQSLESASANENITVAFKERVELMQQINAIQSDININSKKLTEEQKQILSSKLQYINALGEEKTKEQDKIIALKEQLSLIEKQVELEAKTGMKRYDTGIEGEKKSYKNRDVVVADKLDEGWNESSSRDIIENTAKRTNSANFIEKADGETDIDALYVDENKLVGPYQQVKEVQKQFIEDAKEFTKISSNIVSEIDNIGQGEKKVKDLSEEQKATLKANLELIQKMYGGTESYKESIENALTSLDKGEGELQQYVDLIDDIKTGILESGVDLNFSETGLMKILSLGDGIANSEKKVAQMQAQIRQEIDQTVSSFNSFTNVTNTIGGSLTKLAQGVSSIMMSVSMLKSSFEGLTDGEVTFEDLASFAMGASMAIGTLIPLIQGVGSAINTLKSIQTGFNAIQTASNALSAGTTAALTKEKAARVLSIALKEKEAIGEESLTAKRLADIVTQETGIAVTEEDAAVKELLTLVNGEEAVSYDVLAASEMAALWPIGLIILGVTALIALIGGLIYAIYKASRAEEDSLEKSSQNLAKAKERLEEVNNEYNNLISTLDELQSKRDALKDLTEGTVEWQLAVAELNAQMLELADTYGLVYGQDYTMGDDGTYQFIEGAEDRIKETQMNRVNDAASAKYSAQIKKDQDQGRVTAKNGVSAGYIQQTPDGGVYTEFSSQTKFDVASLIAEDAKLAEGSREDFANAIRGLGGAYENYTDEMITNLYNARDQFQDIAPEIAKINADIDGALSGMIASNNANNKDYVNSDHKAVYDKVIKDNYDDNAKVAESNWNKMSKEDKQQEYLKMNYGDGQGGYDPDKVRLANTKGDNFSVQVKNEQGEWVTQGDKNSVNINDVKDSYIQKEATTITDDNDITGKVNNLVETTTDSLTNSMGEAFKGLDKVVQNKLIDAQIANDGQELSTDQKADAINEGLNANVSAASSIEELRAATQGFFDAKQSFNQDIADKIEMDYNAYSEALIGIAENYENTADEVAEYKEVLQNGTEAQIEAAQTALELSTEVGELSEKYDLNAEEVESYAKRLAKGFEKDGDSAALAAKKAATLAVANTRLDRGMSNLNKNLKDYKKNLDKSNKGTADWSKSMDNLKTDLADMLNLGNKDDLSDQFAEDVLASKDLEKALDGDMEALSRIQLLAADDIVAGIKANIENKEDMDAFQSDWDYLKANMEQGIAAGNVDQSQLVESFNDMIEKGNMTKDQIEGALAGMQVSANVVTTYVPQKVTVPQTITEEKLLPNGTGTVSVPDPNSESGWSTKPVELHKKITTTYDAGEVEVDGVVPQYKIEGTKGSDGKITNAFAPAPPKKPSKASTTSGSKGSGGGGGGGGGSKPKEKKSKNKKFEKKKKTDEVDRYIEINKKLDDQARKLEKISLLKDKAFGKNKLKQMDAEIAGLEKELQLQKEYGDEIERNLKNDKKRIEQGKKNKDGKYEKNRFLDGKSKAKFDKNGNITNETDIRNNAVDEYNAELKKLDEAKEKARQKFNNSERTEKDEKAYNKAIEEIDKKKETLDKQYDEFEELLDQYNETVELQKDNEQDQLEKAAQILSAKLEKVSYNYELKLSVNDDDLKVLQSEMSKLSDYKFSESAQITNLVKQNDIQMSNSDAARSQVAEALVAEGLSEEDAQKYLAGDQDVKEKVSKMDLSSDTIEILRTSRDAMLDAAEEARQNVMQAFDLMEQNYEQHIEDIDRMISKYDHLGAVTDSYRNAVDLLGASFLKLDKNQVKAMRDTSVKNLQAKTTSLKKEMDSIDKEREAVVAEARKYKEQMSGLDKKSEEYKAAKLMYQQYKEQADKMQDDFEAKQEEMLSTWEESLQAIKDNFLANIEDALDKYKEGMSGISLDKLSEDWERRKTLSAEYVADYKKIYELSKLNRDITKSINDSDNLKNKQGLAKFQEKINDLQKTKAQWSEYDLEVLNKEFELEKAKAAWEEAQNAKDSVKMQRDASGNWSYVYTANDDKTADAQQAYEDKLYALQDYNSQYIDQMQESLITLQTEMIEKISALRIEDYASEEEYMAAVEEIQQEYAERMRYAGEQIDNALANNKDLYDNYWTEYSATTGYLISSDEDFVDSFTETFLSQETGLQNSGDFVEDWKQRSGELLDDCSTAYKEYAEDIDESMKASGTSLDGFSEKMDEEFDPKDGNITKEIDKTKKKVDALAEAFEKDFGRVLTAVDTAATQYVDKISKMIDENDKLVASINSTIRAIAGLDGSSTTTKATTKNTTTKATTKAAAGGGGKSTTTKKPSAQGDGKLKVGDYATLKKGHKYHADSWGGGASGYYNEGISQGVKIIGGNKKYVDGGTHSSTGDYYVLLKGSGKNKSVTYDLGWVKPSDIEGYDTGGYTGNWNSKDGKLAMLHEKELVLNKGETKDFLAAMKILDVITKQLDIQALASANGLGGLIASNINSPLSNKGEGIEQNITIQADFPNATNHNEIEEAFNNMVNSALQFANR